MRIFYNLFLINIIKKQLKLVAEEELVTANGERVARYDGKKTTNSNEETMFFCFFSRRVRRETDDDEEG